VKSVVAGKFFSQNTATGIRFTARSIMDCEAEQKFHTERCLPYFTFHTKVNKPVEAAIRHMPGNISSEDFTMALQELDSDFIS
jgi:hypothetical protein